MIKQYKSEYQLVEEWEKYFIEFEEILGAHNNDSINHTNVHYY